MQKRSFGPRPQYFSDPALDWVLVILMTVAEELAVVRARLDSFERVAEAHGVVTRADIASFEPDADAAEEREAWRTGYIERLLRIVIEEGERPTNSTGVEEIIATVSGRA
jgi:hypothetical protein